MFLKGHFCSSLACLFFCALIIGGCASSGSNSNGRSSSPAGSIEGSLSLPQQTAPPNDIQSIQLHPQDQPGQPPIISLKGNQKLILSFDYIGTQSKQFRVTVTHYSQEWNQSNIGPNTYLDSFSETTIQSSQISFSQRPSYHHLEFSFPNNELRPAVSGNYLIKVYSSDENTLLFSMPFFITEDEGTIETEVDRLFAQRDDGRPLDQLFSTYNHPDFVEYPQFDLAMSFVQNQFWGRTKQVKHLDTITSGQLRGYVERDNAFVGNYEFKSLNLRNFDADGRQILGYQPGVIPPKVTLRRDIQHLTTTSNLSEAAMSRGVPDNNRRSEYAQVEFQLETDDSINPSSDIYIVGHFNNWMINDLNKMSYNSEDKIWEGRALIKQGQYAYKYVLLSNNRVDDLSLDQGFLSSSQEYLTFIYFNDPDRHFDRLLKVDRVIKK